MIVARNIEDIHDTLTGTCLTIGNFDGVHMGHARLLRRGRERAAATDMISMAVTFDPHPRRVLLDKNAPPLLTLTEQKLELLEQSGIQVTVLLPFTRALAALEPEEFVREKLVAGLCMREMVIGYDYAFGKGRKGNYELLSALGRSCGFAVERLDPVIIDGAVVSSTRIRDMIEAGDVWTSGPCSAASTRCAAPSSAAATGGDAFWASPRPIWPRPTNWFPKPACMPYGWTSARASSPE
jgi:riboflavin kinase/FMN adenylyltransferase